MQPGEAAIKSEFLVKLDDILPGAASLETENSLKKMEGVANGDHRRGCVDGENGIVCPDSSSPMLTAEKKLRGQNKKRPRTVPKVEEQYRLCRSLSLGNKECPFGDKCKFGHDVQEYLRHKKPDLGVECLHYRRTGKCPYGFECRFGGDHISSNCENLFDEDKYRKYCDSTKDDCTNVLRKDTMILLRKKKYDFTISENVFKTVCSTVEATDDGAPEIMQSETPVVRHCGAVTDEDCIRLRTKESRKIDFRDKLYLAPLTTVGNLPFRRICKRFGADITCGEMAVASNLLQGQQSEWALLRRHPSEDIFGVQLCGGNPNMMVRCTELLNRECSVDFIDINLGCPIDLIFKKGEGSALMGRMAKLKKIVQGMVMISDVPITVKMRTGIYENKCIAHKVIPAVREWGAEIVTLHGRTREQRYTKAADWDYIGECAKLASPMPLFGNGDILSFEDACAHREKTGVSGVMIARGALIKPWIFTEVKEQRHWDISSSERFDILKDYVAYGLEHWGSDDKGVENTRRFLLEWLSFLHRYIPVGVLEKPPQKMNERPPAYQGRDDLETLFSSKNCADWIKISEMLLGPVPDNFSFMPKHKANSYS